MKIKAAIWVFIVGYLFDFVGSWMKIMHQPFSDFVLTFGVLLKVLGLLLTTILVFRHPKVKSFLAEG